MHSVLKSRVNVLMLLFASALASNGMAGGLLGPTGASASAGDFASAPPLAVTGADPFLMIDLSVELTQQAEAFTDGPQTYAGGTICPDRMYSQSTPWGNKDLGVCYASTETYIGYFDSEKCYTYDISGSNANVDQQAKGPRSDANPYYFKPIGKATGHTCSKAFSGNFLNWSTMTALDEFRSAMTGGARLVDTGGTNASTLLIRTRRDDKWPFVMKSISKSGLKASLIKNSVTIKSQTFTTDPATVTPFDLSAGSDLVSVTVTPVSSTKNGVITITTTTTTTQNNYSATDTIYVVNDFSQLSTNPGASTHRTRFYTFPSTANKTVTTRVVVTKGGVQQSDTTTVGSPSTISNYVRQLGLPTSSVNEFNVVVKACDPSAAAGGLEANCIKYTDGTNTWYKPEGLLQKNALKMRYALDSYTARSGNVINGGVLRANAKYVGYQMPTSAGGIQLNPNAEVDQNGLFVFDPDKLAGKVGVNSVAPINSGIINYINQFGLFAGIYKANDPDAELYYEGLRYLMHLGPTNSFRNPSTALSASEQDGYPMLGSGNAGSPAWADPIASSCQKNYALYVGDKNSHRQNYLPGGTSLGSDDPACSSECTDAVAKGINATSLEGDIGSRDGGSASTDYGNEHGDGLAALAWWARTHDIRTDITGEQSVKTFVVDTQEFGGTSANPVGTSNTLWRAAKWGGFEDSNKDVFGAAAVPSPDLTSEWNAKGASFTNLYSGTTTPLPDTYTLASQPVNMVAGLTSAFDNVLQATSSAAAAAVVANSSVGTAAIYQAIYQPQISNNTTAVTWTGLVRAFFIDDVGRLREDTNHNGVIDNADNAVSFRQDTVNGQDVLRVTRTSVGGGVLNNDVLLTQLKPPLQPVWDAGQQLAKLTDAAALNQRVYTAKADSGRYIFTWIDANNNGIVDSGEIKSFTATNFPNINSTTNDTSFDPARLLGLDSVSGANATKLVNYIRGVDQANYRNRTIDQGDGNGLQTLRLGDIVHSAPKVVGAPDKQYDLTYGDTTYAAFYKQYQNRRQVLYAGANDGMLHAFNAGFYFVNAGNGGFYTAPNGVNSPAGHPLGSELWAYVPYNLLPHLQWLTATDYQHTYYVDGTPQSFDVNIFADDADHPKGWGTILVVGFRLGGGDITVNANTDQTNITDTGNRTLSSAYLVLDITNPEVAPTVLAELRTPTLGFTVSKPTVVKHRVKTGGSFDNPMAADNQWYLVMGSGPAGTDAANKQLALSNAVSNQDARVFMYDLSKLKWVDANPGTTEVDGFVISGQSASFIGDMAAQDWNDDFTDEVVYFGTVGQGAAPNNDATGDLLRMIMPSNYGASAPTFSTLLSGNTNTPHSGQPFSMAPLLYKDPLTLQQWVYAGSGRFYVRQDISSAKQMTYYGIKEPIDTTQHYTYTDPVLKNSLINTTGIQLYSNGQIVDSTGSVVRINNNPVTTNGGLVDNVNIASGWYFNFNGTAERDVDITELFPPSNPDSLFITGYTASGDTCSPLGSSRRIAACLLTGIACPSEPLNTEDPNNHLILFSTSLGKGQFFSSGIVAVGLGQNQILLDVTQGSLSDSYAQKRNYNPKNYGRRMSWKELPIQ